MLARALPGCAGDVIAELAPLVHRHTVAMGTGLLAQRQVWREALLIDTGLLRLYFVRHDAR